MPTATMKQPVKKNNISVEEFIRNEFPAPKGTYIKIHHLWDNRYSVNYYGRCEHSNGIYVTQLIHKILLVDKNKDGYKAKELERFGFNEYYKLVRKN